MKIFIKKIIFILRVDVLGFPHIHKLVYDENYHKTTKRYSKNIPRDYV